MTKANCIISIFITTMLFWGNNCLIISPEEQSSANRKITNAMCNMELERLAAWRPRAPHYLAPLFSRRRL
jgi:hypothetical protein